MHSLVQALTLTVWVHFLIHCSNNRFFKLIVGALRTYLSEFQGQKFKVGGTLGAELVCFYIQVMSINRSTHPFYKFRHICLLHFY